MNEPPLPLSPYKGLAPFEDSEVDALFFFGRDRDSEVIAANLMASRLTILFGPTGVGKTSVLRAGVAHKLRQEASVEVRVHSSWVDDPGAALADLPSGNGGDLYLMLDQFEEFFLYHEFDRAFADELAEVVRRPDLRVNVLIGIRADSLARLDAFKAAIPNLFSNRLRLENLDRAAGEAAIRGPIGRFNELVPVERRVEVEAALVDAVLDEVAAGRVELGATGRGVVRGRRSDDRVETPFLQLVMSRLWNVETGRGSKVLRLETLSELGGAAKIVEDHLEHAMAELSPSQKDAAAAMYNFLVTPSGSKIAHRTRDLARYAEIREDEAADVLRRLAAERIVRASSENGAGTRYEIFHDVLADAVAAWGNRHSAERAVRHADERRRRARLVATAALLGLLVVAGIAVYALVERNNARTQTRRADARRLAAAATLALPLDPLRSILLGIRAANLDDTIETDRVLREAVEGTYLRRVFRSPDPVVAAGKASVVVGDRRGRLLVFPTGRGATTQYHLRDTVAAVGVSWGGRTIAVGLPRRIVLLHRGQQTSMPLSAAPTSIAVGRDATPLAAGFEDGTVRLLRPRLHRLHVRGSVGSLEFSPDLRLLLIVSKARAARLVDVANGRVLHLLGHKGFVLAAAFSPDGRLVVTASADHTAHIWDARSGRLLHVLGSAFGGISAVAFSPDSRLVAAASVDAVARVYDARTGARLVLLNGHTTALTTIAFSPDGKTIVTGSTDRTARIWVTETGRLLRTLTGHTDTVDGAFFTAGGTRAVTAGADGTVRVWDTGTAPELRPIIRQEDPFTALAVSTDGSLLYVGDARGRTRTWSIAQRRFVRMVQSTPPVTGLAVGPRGLVSVSSPDRAVASSPTGGITVTAGRHGIRVHGARSFRLQPPSETTAVAVSRDGKLIAGGTADGTVRVWNADGGLVRVLRGHHDEVLSVSFSGDARRLLTGSRDGDARVWNLAGGAAMVLRGHGGPVFDANFSSDGQWIVTAGPITAGVWPAASGRLAFLLYGPGPVLRAALFIPNSLRIVTAGDDGTVRTYDCEICRSGAQLVAVARARLAAARPG